MSAYLLRLSGAAVLALSTPLAVLAQDTSAPPPAGASANVDAAAAAAAEEAAAETSVQGDAAATAGGLRVGLSVRDSAGAAIGEVTELKPGADGKQMATIRMGENQFAVDASALSVAGDAATLDATRAQIESQIEGSAP